MNRMPARSSARTRVLDGTLEPMFETHTGTENGIDAAITTDDTDEFDVWRVVVDRSREDHR